MSNTLTTITNQLGATGPLGTILGDVKKRQASPPSSCKGLPRTPITAKAQVDGAKPTRRRRAHPRMPARARHAQRAIRDEHTTSSLHCVALDAGQTVTASSGSSFQVTQSISDVADNRGEAGPNQPAFYGQAQAVAAIAQLHFSRYCSQAEATAGLCTLSSTPNADQRASTLFGTGTLAGQAGRQRRQRFRHPT